MKSNSRSTFILATFVFWLSYNAAVASEWAVDADGNWNVAGNWTGPIPDGNGATALFGSAISSDRTVTFSDPSDNNITASQLAFDGHFDYFVELQPSQKLTLTGNPIASFLLSGVIGNASHNVEYRSITGGAVIALPPDFTVRNDSAGILTLRVPGSGANVSLTKTGPGGALIAMGSSQYSGASQIVVNEGTFSGYMTFADKIVLDGGRFLSYATNTKSIVVGPAGGTIEVLTVISSNGSTWTSSTNSLSGSGVLTKEGLGRLALNAAQTSFTGSVLVRAGQFDASHASQPLANATQFSIAGASGIFAGQLRLSTSNLSGKPVSIGSGGVLVAPSGANVGLATLIRGVNLTAEPGAVLAQTTAGGNASIQGLGPTQDLFFGIGTSQNISALTVGAGTPWRGISGIGTFSTTLNSTSSGSITANSDFAIQHYDELFKLNNTSILSSGDRHTATIAAPTAGSLSQGAADQVLGAGISTSGEGVTITGTPNLSGVSNFVVTNGATFTISSAGVLGTGATQAPVIEMRAGGDFIKTAVSNPSVPDTLGVGNAAATIIIKGPSHVRITSPTDVTTPLGGKFIVESRIPSSVVLGSATTGIGVDSLTFATNEAAISATGSVEGPTLIAVGNATANVAGDSSSLGTLNLRGGLVGAGVFTKGSGGTLIIDGAKSNFGGPGSQLRIDAGIVQLNNSSFDAGPNGPEIYIGQSPRIGLPGIFSIPTDVDEGAKLTPDSVGILALRSDNSTLSGVNNSAAFIGADGTHSLTTSSLAPGSGGAYRLGGGINTPVLNLTGAGVLTGTNDVVIGMPASALGSVLKNGNGTVVLQNSNSYTGSTKINAKSTLIIEAAHGIGDGGSSAGPVLVDGTLTVRGNGTIGAVSAIHINYGAELQIDERGVQNANRIPDSVPVVFLGGTLNYIPDPQATITSTESIGQSPSGMLFSEGASLITFTDVPTTGTVALSLGQVHRQLGATLSVVRNGQQTIGITIDNIASLKANGIIPWSPSLAPYSGPYAADINATAASDNVASTTVLNPLTGDRTMNSVNLIGNVDTGGHVMNVGTLPIDGVASGRMSLSSPITIGSGAAPGYLTAGQAAFAPNSAAPGELIVFATSNPPTIAAAIIDNAGDDGVFGTTDDLPVTLTKSGTGTLNLTNANNRFSGGTFINEGTLNLTAPVPGNVTLHSGKLQLSSSIPNTYFIGGDIVVSNSQNLAASSATPLIEVPTYSGLANSSDRAAYLMHGLTVTPGSIVNLRGDFAVTGAADVRGAQLFVNTNFSFVGVSSLKFRGEYLDDVRTVIRSRASSSDGGSYLNGTRFQSGNPVDVHATFIDVPRVSAELDTTVNFYGALSRTRSSTSAIRVVAAATGGTVRLMPGATVDAADGWSGNFYDTDLFKLLGDASGTIEFVDGFKLMQAGGTNHFEDRGANAISIESPVTFITNHTDNLPNFDSAVMDALPPNIYLGEINMRANGARWIVQSHPQTYNQKIDFAADSRIIANTPLTFTVESAVGMGDKDNITLSSSQSGLREGTQSGSLEKLGPEDLTILGRLSVANYTRTIVSEGRLLLSNKSYEGYGRMDVEVRSGATLAGGSIDGTAGLLPGTLTIKAGGTLDPGNSPFGIISVVGDAPHVVFDANSAYRPDLGGMTPGQSHDQLKLLGHLALGDSLGLPILTPELDYIPALGDLMFVVQSDSTSPTAGFFKGISGQTLGQGSVFDLTSSLNGQKYYFQISYRGDTASGLFDASFGNDIALRAIAIAIPEPACVASFMIAYSLVACCRLRLDHRNAASSGSLI